MIFSLAMYRLESGLYTLSFNTEAANFLMYDEETKQVQSVGVLVLNILLIATAIVDIRRQQAEQKLIDQAQRDEDQEPDEDQTREQ